MFRLLLLCLMGASTAAAAEPDRSSHCTGDEAVVFTCAIGAKIASVCGSNDLWSEDAYVQYRFGRKGSVELEVPPRRGYRPDMVGHMSALCGSCIAVYLRFSSGDHNYYVSSVSTRGSDDPKTGVSTRDESAGVSVLKNGRFVYSKPCTSAAFDREMMGSLGKAVVPLKAEDDMSPLNLAFPAKR